MDVIIKKSIQEIEEDVWNSIIKENSITKSHAFLLSVERSMSMVNKFWYFLFYEDNQLVGHASLFTHFVKMEDVIGNKQFEIFVEKMRKSLKNLFRIKVLGCGTPIATCSDEITIVDGYLDHDKIMEVLVKEMKKIACIEKVNFIMIRDFTSESAVDEIKYLLKGGRARGILDICNNRIKIKPILTINHGEYQLLAVSRGNNKAIQKMCRYIREYFEVVDECPQDYRWCIGMGINENDAIELKELVEQTIGVELDIEIQRIGVVVAAHTGPYLMGVAFVKKYKKY